MSDRGLARIDEAKASGNGPGANLDAGSIPNRAQTPVLELSDHFTTDSSDWKDFFPFSTPQTSTLVTVLLGDTTTTLFGDFMRDRHMDLAAQFQDFFAPLGDFGGVSFPGDQYHSLSYPTGLFPRGVLIFYPNKPRMSSLTRVQV